MIAITKPAPVVRVPKVMGRTKSRISGIAAWMLFAVVVALVAAVSVFRLTGGSYEHGQDLYSDAEYVEMFGFPKPGGGDAEVVSSVEADPVTPVPVTTPDLVVGG